PPAHRALHSFPTRRSSDLGMAGMVTTSSTLDRVFSPFEVASLDIQGQKFGVPISTLLGGQVRSHVPFSGYLFYKWAGHPNQPERSEEHTSELQSRFDLVCR